MTSCIILKNIILFRNKQQLFDSISIFLFDFFTKFESKKFIRMKNQKIFDFELFNRLTTEMIYYPILF